MLLIQPDKEIVVEFIKNPEYNGFSWLPAIFHCFPQVTRSSVNEFVSLIQEYYIASLDSWYFFFLLFFWAGRYVRVLGAFYLRLTTGTDVDIYRYLEPLYNDYRKLRQRLNDAKFSLTHVDEYIDELLTKDYSCDIALPRIKKRWTLEAIGTLEPRRSALEDDFEEEEEKDEDEQLADGLDYNGHEAHDKDHYRGQSPTRERDRDRRRDGHRYRDRDYERDREYDRDRGRGRDRDRDRHRLRDGKDYGRERERDREQEPKQKPGSQEAPSQQR